MSFQSEKVHIFKPNELLTDHAKANMKIEGAIEMLDTFTFTATHGPRPLAPEIEENAKQIFAMSMLLENVTFFQTFNFKKVSPISFVNQLWDYESFDVDSSLNNVWGSHASKINDIKNIEFIDHNDWVIFDHNNKP